MLTGLPRYAYNQLRPPRPESCKPTALAAGSSQPTANSQPPTAPQSPDFWALKDVSFEVQPGEVVGIIGRNGAGKSTLLKILSRITEPTSGRFGVRGRVASLLEVGTGFHPELTGRENIYVSGITLGMTRSEIKKRFDEIVDFSGVEKFLDTPVKHYSSGMQVRLGFAVAAHLESEILIIDEVLAVGDAEFQKRCISKMGDVASGGRTVLFVTHMLDAVRRMCSTALVLDRGTAIPFGSMIDKALEFYGGVGGLEGLSTNVNADELSKHVNPWFTPLSFKWTDSDGTPVPPVVRKDQQSLIVVRGRIAEVSSDFTVGYMISSSDGQVLYWSCFTDMNEDEWPQWRTGDWILTSPVPTHFLNEGVYRIELVIKSPGRDWICRPGLNSPQLCVEIKGGLSESCRWTSRRSGFMAPVLPWQASLQTGENGDL
ncbi:ABC transporter ATP-binding protein [Neorhodopirellula pilleata]|nr:ABC transporter ATP-binding protein [Neorhodopirellula pilleata]